MLQDHSSHYIVDRELWGMTSEDSQSIIKALENAKLENKLVSVIMTAATSPVKSKVFMKAGQMNRLITGRYTPKPRTRSSVRTTASRM